MKKVLWFVLTLALVLSACGGGGSIVADAMILSEYDIADDPIVEAYEVGGTEGEYSVYRQQGNYFTELGGDDLPNAVYVTYFWQKSNESTASCPETFSGIPLYQCDTTFLGFTDQAPETVCYSTTMFYGTELKSASSHMQKSGSLARNTMPSECSLENNGKPIIDCTVEIIVPVP